MKSTRKQLSVAFTPDEWERLNEIAFEVGAKATAGSKIGRAGWRVMLRLIVQGQLVVMPREHYDRLVKSKEAV